MSDRSKIPWWGDNPWWEDPRYSRWLECSAEGLRAAAECMKGHFDRDWWDRLGSPSALRPNPIAGWLLGSGLLPCRFIYRLGTALNRLHHCPGLGNKISELKEGSKAVSVLFEIDVAAALARDQLSVRFPPETDSRSPDIVVTADGAEVAVECKRLEVQHVDKWTDDLLSLVTANTPTDCGFGFQVKLAPELSFLRKDKPPSWNSAIARALTAEIRAAIDAALESPPLPTCLNVPGIAEVTVVPGHPGQGSVEGGLRLATADMRRMVEYIWDSSDQIPEGMPGVFAMQCDFSPGKSLVRATLNAALESPPSKAPVDRVFGLVIVPTIPLGPLGEPLAVEPMHRPNNKTVQRVLQSLVGMRSVER